MKYVISLCFLLLSLFADFLFTSVLTLFILILVGFSSIFSWKIALAVYLLMWMIRLHVSVGVGGGKK